MKIFYWRNHKNICCVLHILYPSVILLYINKIKVKSGMIPFKSVAINLLIVIRDVQKILFLRNTNVL